MTRVILEVPRIQDIDLLLAFCQSLDIKVVQKSDQNISPLLKKTPPYTFFDQMELPPVRQSQTIEDMLQEQEHTFDRVVFDRIIEEMDVQDPEDNLFKLLRA
jgi:hypothetical protein